MHWHLVRASPRSHCYGAVKRAPRIGRRVSEFLHLKERRDPNAGGSNPSARVLFKNEKACTPENKLEFHIVEHFKDALKLLALLS